MAQINESSGITEILDVAGRAVNIQVFFEGGAFDAKRTRIKCNEFGIEAEADNYDKAEVILSSRIAEIIGIDLGSVRKASPERQALADKINSDAAKQGIDINKLIRDRAVDLLGSLRR